MKRTAVLLLALVANFAFAGNSAPAPSAHSKWQEECGSCHVAFPPHLLAADNWKSLMGGLDKHFGANATLDAQTNKLILGFLLRNAGNGDHYRADSLRISETPWFKHEHHVISPKEWARAEVNSRSNCSACHGKVVLRE